jgi:hypothetical protein
VRISIMGAAIEPKRMGALLDSLFDVLHVAV